MAFNLVEAIQGEDSDCAFDQPCKFGHRVDGHAVYCHHDDWEDGPRKCRRSWYTGGEVKDEDCPGFEPSSAFKGGFSPTPLSGSPCSTCNGVRRMPTDRGRTETCDHCCGSGAEPSAMPLSEYEQDTLELGCTHSGKASGAYEHFVRIAETAKENDALTNLMTMELIALRSMSCTKSKAMVWLIRLTGKGDAVMRANWAQKDEKC